MSTLKQKVEMIEELKNHGSEYGEKLTKAQEDEIKIVERVKILEDKEEEHKLAVTKAHLVIEDYKNCIFEVDIGRFRSGVFWRRAPGSASCCIKRRGSRRRH